MGCTFLNFKFMHFPILHFGLAPLWSRGPSSIITLYLCSSVKDRGLPIISQTALGLASVGLMRYAVALAVEVVTGIEASLQEMSKSTGR